MARAARTARRRLYQRDVTYYTEGDCWLLAYWLAKLAPEAGLELTVVTDGELSRRWSHVAVTDGRRVLDVEGWHEAAAWRRRWRATWRSVRTARRYAPTTLEEYARALGMPGHAWSQWDRTHAQHRAVARYLLALPQEV